MIRRFSFIPLFSVLVGAGFVLVGHSFAQESSPLGGMSTDADFSHFEHCNGERFTFGSPGYAVVEASDAQGRAADVRLFPPTLVTADGVDVVLPDALIEDIAAKGRGGVEATPNPPGREDDADAVDGVMEDEVPPSAVDEASPSGSTEPVRGEHRFTLTSPVGDRLELTYLIESTEAGVTATLEQVAGFCPATPGAGDGR